MAEPENHSKKYIESGAPLRHNGVVRNQTGKVLAAIYRQEIIEDISLFTAQPVVSFYRQVLDSMDFSLPRAKTGRKGFPQEAMLKACVVMKCEGLSQGSEIADYLDNNRIIAHYCGFNIMKPLPSQWTFTRFLRELDNGELQRVMAGQTFELYELGVIDGSFIGLDSTPVFANTKQNNPKSFSKNKFSKENHPSCDPDCALGVYSASNQHNEKRVECYWGYKSHTLVDLISGLPICEMTTGANVADSSVAIGMLRRARSYLPLTECAFMGDKAFDVKAIYNYVRDELGGECFIPLNRRNTKDPQKLPCGNVRCEAGLAMHRDGKTKDSGRTRQKFCCPFRQSKTGECPCNHKNWNNGKKNRGCTRYVTIPDDYRLSIDRDSRRFKTAYALRTECERHNSRLKQTGQERLWCRNGSSAANLNSIANIAILAVAKAAVLGGNHYSYRALKSAKRSA